MSEALFRPGVDRAGEGPPSPLRGTLKGFGGVVWVALPPTLDASGIDDGDGCDVFDGRLRALEILEWKVSLDVKAKMTPHSSMDSLGRAPGCQL